ncbi:MAG: hypothetical protein Q9178_002205 [Gyalolechia marmorata]
MDRRPSSVKQQGQENAAATLGLLELTLRNIASTPSAPGLQIRNITAASTVDGVPRGNLSSKQAINRWRLNPQPPVYQPLNIAPLGTSSHHAPAPIVDEGVASKPRARRRTLKKRAEQSVSHRQEAPSSPRNDESFKYSPTIRSRPVPSRNTRLQPQDRRFATLASPPAPELPTARRPSPVGSVKGPATPIPHASYLAQSAISTVKRSTPQPLLLVLDLNGTLLYRPKASSTYKPRPSLESFLSHCISNYKVLIWSSATPQNVTAICSQIFTPNQRKLLLGEWARDTLDLTALQYSSKVQVYKRLDRIWNKECIQRTHPDFKNGQRWGQWNTLLLDDSVLKSSAQPYNAVVVPEFTKQGVLDEAGGIEVLGQVVAYLETAKRFDNLGLGEGEGRVG